MLFQMVTFMLQATNLETTSDALSHMLKDLFLSWILSLKTIRHLSGCLITLQMLHAKVADMKNVSSIRIVRFEVAHLRKVLTFATNVMSFPVTIVDLTQIFRAGRFKSIKQFKQSVSRNTMKKLRMNLDIDRYGNTNSS